MGNIDGTLGESIQLLYQMAENGLVENAIAMFEKLGEVVPEREQELLLERARLEEKYGRDKEALDDYLFYLNQKQDVEVLNHLIATFSEKIREACENNRNKNSNMLVNYDFFFGELSGHQTTRVLYVSDNAVFFYSESHQSIIKAERQPDVDIDYKLTGPVIFFNYLFTDEIRKYHEKNIPSSVYAYKIPFYLYFEPEYLDAFMQAYDLSEYINYNRIVFIMGKESLCNYFWDDEIEFPNVYRNINDEYGALIYLAKTKVAEKGKLLERKVKDFYKNEWEGIYKRIQNGNPRIMLITSRFNATTNYQTKYLYDELVKLGYTCKFVQQKNSVSLGTTVYELRNIDEFKPDIIFRINHYRKSLSAESEDYIPKEVVFITWIEDPWSAENLFDLMKLNRNKVLSERDILFSVLDTNNYRGYELYGIKERLTHIPFAADDSVYKKYNLTKSEYEKYAADICFVGHQSDYERAVNEKAGSLGSQGAYYFKKINDEYKKMAYDWKFIYSKEGFIEFLISISKAIGIDIVEEALEPMSMWFLETANQRLYRQVLVDAILEAGFTNIKLWGEGWLKVPRYKKYAMGPAENGEELSKILQASRIVVGSNPIATYVQRVCETMLSGGFYLSNVLPEDEDVCSLKGHVEEDNEVVFFRSKEELIGKINYYLKNDAERQRIAENGRKKAIKTMSYRGLAERIMKDIPIKLEKQISGKLDAKGN